MICVCKSPKKILNMNGVIVLLAVIGVALANSATLLHPSDVTQDLITNSRYLLFERQDGYIEVEDLYNSTDKPILNVNEKDVTFYFFTPQNSKKGVQIKSSQLHNIIKLTGFDINRQTLVIIHGWKNNGESAVNDLIKNAALKNRNINVIVVDWSSIAKKTYVTAQGSVLAVGNYVGDFLIRLDNELKHKLHQVTIVGHSLGAHISGNTGARTKGLIDTIIGLDPAGPLFSQKKTDNRLDPTDAKYVHVVHSNQGLLGFDIKMGHADYYPNGGKSQPGCGVDLTGSCAHGRSYEFFAESLNSNKFKARLCDNWSNYQKNKCNSNVLSYMGSFPVQRSNGDFFLTTNNKSPYAKG